MNGIGMHRIPDAVAIPVEEKIVACPPWEDMHVNMSHRLSGNVTVRLHKAQSVRLQRLVHRASQLSRGCALINSKRALRKRARSYTGAGRLLSCRYWGKAGL